MSEGPEILRECSAYSICHISHVKVVELVGGGSIINGPAPSSFSRTGLLVFQARLKSYSNDFFLVSIFFAI